MSNQVLEDPNENLMDQDYDNLNPQDHNPNDFDDDGDYFDPNNPYQQQPQQQQPNQHQPIDPTKKMTHLPQKPNQPDRTPDYLQPPRQNNQNPYYEPQQPGPNYYSPPKNNPNLQYAPPQRLQLSPSRYGQPQFGSFGVTPIQSLLPDPTSHQPIFYQPRQLSPSRNYQTTQLPKSYSHGVLPVQRPIQFPTQNPVQLTPTKQVFQSRVGPQVHQVPINYSPARQLVNPTQSYILPVNPVTNYKIPTQFPQQNLQQTSKPVQQQPPQQQFQKQQQPQQQPQQQQPQKQQQPKPQFQQVPNQQLPQQQKVSQQPVLVNSQRGPSITRSVSASHLPVQVFNHPPQRQVGQSPLVGTQRFVPPAHQIRQAPQQQPSQQQPKQQGIFDNLLDSLENIFKGKQNPQPQKIQQQPPQTNPVQRQAPSNPKTIPQPHYLQSPQPRQVRQQPLNYPVTPNQRSVLKSPSSNNVPVQVLPHQLSTPQHGIQRSNYHLAGNNVQSSPMISPNRRLVSPMQQVGPRAVFPQQIPQQSFHGLTNQFQNYLTKF